MSMRFVLQKVSSKLLHTTVHKENGTCTGDCSRPKSLLGKTMRIRGARTSSGSGGMRRGRAREAGVGPQFGCMQDRGHCREEGRGQGERQQVCRDTVSHLPARPSEDILQHTALPEVWRKTYHLSDSSTKILVFLLNESLPVGCFQGLSQCSV